MNLLKEKRKELNLTQVQSAKLCGVSRRTYQTYEEANVSNDVYDELYRKLQEQGILDNTNIILGKRQIKRLVTEVFEKHPAIRCAYLFGSYARGEATKDSDVDLLVVLRNSMGMEFFGIIEELEEKLNKKVDLLTSNQIVKNELLMKEILSDGEKIYGWKN